MTSAIHVLAHHIIQTVPTPMVVLDAALRIQAANEAFEAMFNGSRAPLLGRPLPELRKGQWDEAVLQAVRVALDGHEASIEATGIVTDEDGRGPLTIRIDARWLAGGDEQSLMLLSLFDVTAERRHDAILAGERLELERSNAALAEFAHSASHDLQEPLRKIMSYSDRVIRDHGELLPPEGRNYLSRITAAAARMRTLTDGLLATARASAIPAEFQLVDLGSIAREVLQDLDARVEELRARVTVGDLPSIDADPFQMRQLMQNLLTNGLKFHRTDAFPELSIAAETSGNVMRLSVRDNGIGFAEKYRERIFGMFMRLHAQSEYDGSGIGLSLCRTIALRHNGSISATSKPGQGSTFIVTLPITQPPAAGLKS